MSLPLATLRRHATRILLDDSFARTSALSTTALSFRARHDAVRYLRFWRSDAAAMAALRDALYRYRRGPIFEFSDDEVIEMLADHLSRGALVFAAENATLGPSTPSRPRPLPAAAMAEESPPPRRVVSPGEAPPPRLLPKLEEVQIEGAMVLPEVLETLEQLELTMGQIGLATVSLEPAPSGLPPIGSSLSGASASITATLDGL